MNVRENYMAVLHHEKPDRIPWVIYDIPYPMLPRGSWERQMRNLGLGIVGLSSFHPAGNIFKMETREVEIEQRLLSQDGRSVIATTYHTPCGSISKKEDMDISPPNPWVLEYPIKSVSDFEAAEFLFSNTRYLPNFEAYNWANRHIGGDGIIRVSGVYSPLQSLLVKYMGCETLVVHFYEHRAELEHLLQVMGQKYVELIQLIANSPAEVIGIDGNVDGRITSPSLFERYLLPLYRKACKILHAKNKIVMVHMDGLLRPLKKLIPETGIDVVEAFTPPPGGDLTISEARSLWGDNMVITINFPEALCVEGVEQIKKYTLRLLGEMAPGDSYLLSITEDMPHTEPDDILEASVRAITEVMWQHGKYPIKAGR